MTPFQRETYDNWRTRGGDAIEFEPCDDCTNFMEPCKPLANPAKEAFMCKRCGLVDIRDFWDGESDDPR